MRIDRKHGIFHAFSRTKKVAPVQSLFQTRLLSRLEQEQLELPEKLLLVGTRSPTGATNKNPILEPHSIPKKNDNSSMAYTIYTIYTIPCVKIIVVVMSPNQTSRVRFTSPIVTRYSFYRFCWYLSMIEIHHPLSVFHSRDLHFKHIFTLCSHPCTGQISASSKTKQKKVKRSNHSFRCFF